MIGLFKLLLSMRNAFIVILNNQIIILHQEEHYTRTSVYFSCLNIHGVVHLLQIRLWFEKRGAFAG